MNNRTTYFIGLLILISMFYSYPALTQNTSIDSLKNVLLSQKEDSNKVIILNKLSKQLVYKSKNSEALEYSLSALKLAEKIKYKKGMEGAYWAVIASYYELSDYNNYIEFSINALHYFQKEGNLNKVGDYLNNMALINQMMGDTTESLKNLFDALKVRRQIDDKWGIIQSINSIGLIYSEQGKYKEALQQHFSALKLWNDLPDKKGYEQMIAFTHQSIGVAYEYLGDLANNNGNKKIAMVEYKKALESHRLSYYIWKGLDLEESVAGLTYYMGKVQVKLKNYDSANLLLQKSLQFYLETGINEEMDGIYLSLSQIDTARGNYKEAYKNYKQYIFYKEAKENKVLIRKFESKKGSIELEKKETQLKLLNTESKLQTMLAKEQSEKKNFAYAFIGLILVAGSYSFYRFRQRRRIKSIEALNKERLRISQELHDEVGATLSGISMYSHLTKEQLKHAQTNEVEKSLNIMQQSAGDMVKKLNDIVWLINPGQDTLQKLIQRLSEFASDMAAIKNMQLKILVPQQFSNQILPVESRRNIYLFCKEGITNAVKYSEATLLQLTIKEDNQFLDITISDNGKGCNIETVRRGNGLNNMEKRADELGADFSIQSEAGEGCLITLKVKITGLPKRRVASA